MLSLALAALLAFQNPPPAPPPLPGEKKETPAPAVAPQAPALVPGAIPASAGAEERARWQDLCRAALVPGATRVPLNAFDLWLDVQFNNSATQSNEATKLRYRYQAPSFLRAMTEHGYELVSGPKGDFNFDPKRGETLPLPVGREGAEDRRQLAEILDLARNFVALSDPAALRIAELRTGVVEPALFPEALRKSLEGLSWLELLTPDFRLPKAAENGLVRVRLGFRPGKPLPVSCIVSGANAGAANWIEVPEYRAQAGLQVPCHLAIHSLDETGKCFQARPTLEVWLKNDSNLHPSFTPETFQPPFK
jgi:hypothetical protein